MMLSFRHIFAVAVTAHLIWIWIDTPKQVYFCPLNREGLTNWADENCYWSTSYAEAREKFVSLGNRLREQLMISQDKNASLDLLDVQSISYNIAGDPEYYKSLQAIDTSTLQTIAPERDTVDAMLLTMRVPEDHVHIIHSSGTHGVEGYLGSAVQIRFLHELFLQNEALLMQNKEQEKASADGNGKVQKILLIHAVNPFGMRHHRRTNENNVDLNRNVLAPDKTKAVIERDANYFGYVDMDPALNPVDSRTQGRRENLPELSSFDTIHTFMKEMGSIASVVGSIVKIIASKGYSNAKRTIVSAQYHKKAGVFYGGSGGWENSVIAVQHAIDEFAGFSLSSGNADAQSKVFWIDVHTGLGKFGSYALLRKETTENNLWTLQLNTFVAGLEEKQASSSKAVSSGYEETVGFINGGVLCPPPSCFAITQEFGTIPGVAVVLSLVLENKGFNWGKGEFAYLTSNAFQPQRLSWRRTALRGGSEMLRAALKFQTR
mmetsp:Transcript_27504/g.39393  ORF Transcript_27504/g.39393 Transcript_27504/m.39393 type:complete len:490 (-) Transcript_27504:68-1537(-)